MAIPRVFRLKRNHGTRTPTTIVLLDVECWRTIVSKRTGHERLTFRLGCATRVRLEQGKPTRRGQLRFTEMAEFWDWLESLQSPHRPVYVFGHNLQFDLKQLGFWQRFAAGEYVVGPIEGGGADPRLKGKRSWSGRMILEARPFYMYLMGRRGRVNFVDSFNFWPESLAKLGDKIGHTKGQVDFENVTDAKLFEYCEQDVSILEQAVVGMMTKWAALDSGCWQPTAAAMAMHSYMHLAPSDGTDEHTYPIVFDRREEAFALERSAYYGGHFEAFYVGPIKEWGAVKALKRKWPKGHVEPLESSPIHYLDVHGFYPAMMRDHLFPRRRICLIPEPSLDTLRESVETNGCIAYVTIRSPENTYPRKHEEHQVHGRGRFMTALAGPELARAVRAGDVEQVHALAVYEMAPLFRTWVDHWHGRLRAARADGDLIEAEFCKLILVSLTGKWAQHGTRWEDRPGHWSQQDFGIWYIQEPAPTAQDPDGCTWRVMRSLCGHVQEKVEGIEPIHSFPAISAFITAYGREWMRHVRSLCPPRSVWYQAADALLCDARAAFTIHQHGLIGDKELGKFQVKGVYDDAEIYGINHYRLGDKWTRSGLWGKAIEGKRGQFYAELWQGIDSVLKGDIEAKTDIVRTPLAQQRGVPKGIIGADGWSEPFTWQEYEDPPF